MNQRDDVFVRAFELGLREAGRPVPSLTQARGPEQETVETPVPGLDGYGIFLADVTWTAEGTAPIELNGSNGAMSSLADGDRARVTHMANAFFSGRRNVTSGVAILAHGQGFHFISEFYARAARFAAALSDTGCTPVALVRPEEPLMPGVLNVVVGAIPDVADHVSRDGGKLKFRGAPVQFLANPNLLPELVRRGLVARVDNSYDIDLDMCHDGDAAVVVHDKGLQLDLAEGTSLRPLRHCDVWEPTEAIARVQELQGLGLGAVIKMNMGSQGAGVEVVGPSAGPDEVWSAVERLCASARGKYGERVEATLWPLRVVEFAEALPYVASDGPHLWDVRVQCLLTPGLIRTTCCMARLCPEPFDRASYQRDGVVSNLSGRPATVRYLRYPPELFAVVGADPGAVHSAAAAWAANAWDWASGRVDRRLKRSA